MAKKKTDTTRIKWHVEQWQLAKLKPYDKNPRIITEQSLKTLKESFDQIGMAQPININTDGTILSGHARVQQLQAEGEKFVDVYVPSRLLSPKEEEAVIIRMNKNVVGEWDFDILEASFDHADLLEWGFEEKELAETAPETNEDGPGATGGPNLAEQFGAPPFSILDSRQGYWQQRKREWLELGIKSEEGRAENLLKHNMKLGKGPKYKNYTGGDAFQGNGTSVFDPVLCELSYLWYSKEEDHILDPFAGGSVRGIVASHLSRKYSGIDLRAEQIAANKAQMKIAKPGFEPTWVEGDSLDLATLVPEEADFVFSCPPYADLEVYSDNPKDLSNMSYEDFLLHYRAIIMHCYQKLKPNRFACFVIGEVRGKDGAYYNFVGDTIKAFTDAGFTYYNEATLITPLGTVMLRAAKMFKSGRKLCKTHQNVLVFCKGSWKEAAARLGDVYVPDIEGEAETEQTEYGQKVTSIGGEL